MPFTPRDLERLNDDAFSIQLKAVARVRHSHPEEWEPFLDAAVSLRVIGVLSDLLNDAKVRLAASLADPEAFAADGRDIMEYRRRANMFIAGTKELLAEVREASGLNWRGFGPKAARIATLREQLDVGQAYRHRMLRLGAAIRRHRFESAVADLDPEPYDLELWALLDEPVPRSHSQADDASLAEVLDRVEAAMAKRRADGTPEPKDGAEWRELLTLLVDHPRASITPGCGATLSRT